MPDWIEWIGFMGTGLTLAARGICGAVALRVTGPASGAAFLSCGLLSGSPPVMVTELLLFPPNGFRLWEPLRESRPSSGAVRAWPRGVSRSAIVAAGQPGASTRSAPTVEGSALTAPSMNGAFDGLWPKQAPRYPHPVHAR